MFCMIISKASNFYWWYFRWTFQWANVFWIPNYFIMYVIIYAGVIGISSKDVFTWILIEAFVLLLCLNSFLAANALNPDWITIVVACNDVYSIIGLLLHWAWLVWLVLFQVCNIQLQKSEYKKTQRISQSTRKHVAYIKQY